MPALSGDLTRILDGGFRPRWSPDGHQILYQTRANSLIPDDVHVLDYPAGTTRTVLPYVEKQDPYCYAEWSPDGRRIVSRSGAFVAGLGLFISPSTGPEGGFFLDWQGQRIPKGVVKWAAGGRALILESSTLDYVPLDRTGHPNGPPAHLSTSPDRLGDVSRDGKTLAFVGGRSQQSDVWRVPIDPKTGVAIGPPQRITDSSAPDVWPLPLPDNQHLLFISGRDGGRNLYIADLDGSHVRLIDKSRVWTSVVAVSGDGRTVILWDRNDPLDQYQTYVLPFDPRTLEAVGAPRRVGHGLGTSLSSDGRYLIDFLQGQKGFAVWENPAQEHPTPLEWPLARFIHFAPLRFGICDVFRGRPMDLRFCRK